MKLYNIKPVKRKFSWGEMDVISLGEEGRGRRLTIIPFHANISNLEGDNFQIGRTLKGFPKIVNGESSDGYIAKLSAEGVYTRNTYGSVYIHPDDKEKIKIIASGNGAYGLAGRIGEWYEFLVEISPQYPIRFYVQPSGGEHKIKGYYVVVFTDKVYKVPKEEIQIFEDQMGISLNNIIYVDLNKLI